MKIIKERVYDALHTPGYRVLVDRLWPRGIKKETLAMDLWAKDLSPSPKLRQWFNHEPDKFEEFRQAYLEELKKSEQVKDILRELSRQSDPIIFLYAAKDPIYNHVNVLVEFIEDQWKG